MDPTRRNLIIGGSILGVCTIGGLLPSACAMRQINRKPAVTMNNIPQRPEGEAKPKLEEDIANKADVALAKAAFRKRPFIQI